MSSGDDLARARAVLQADRAWALYALGDLEPRYLPHCRWGCDGEAVVLLYERFEVPVLLAVGDPLRFPALFAALGPPPRLHLHVRPEIPPLLKPHYEIAAPRVMRRMRLDPETFRGVRTVGSSQIIALSSADQDALAELYADGAETGESPDFFSPEMIPGGSYFGVRENGSLIAAAGTHLVGPGESVAAVGNVYTRRDRRGRGLGRITTAAVVTSLLDRGIRTVGLSVAETNHAAQSVYRRLGFAPHCDFIEGLAVARIGEP